MNRHANGTVKKNNTSSIGNCKIFIPVIYFGLKAHTPFAVK